MSAEKLPLLKGTEQVPLEGLLGKKVAIIGYGNQGSAHALNLRDSGIDVTVGARDPRRAQDDGFQVVSFADASTADLVIIALPDEVQGEVFRDEICSQMKPDVVLGFIHGFAIHFGQIDPPEGVGVVMVAPKGPGVTVREKYLNQSGVPALLAVERENTQGTARSYALGWAAGIGAGRTAVIESTFADETETDLFGEQAIIVGGLTTLMRAAYETLVEAGYPPYLAYIECCHEVKQVADILHEKGMSEMMAAISNTAELGAYEAMDLLDDEHLRNQFRTILQGVRDGSFANRLVGKKIPSKREALRAHDIDEVGKEIRSILQLESD